MKGKVKTLSILLERYLPFLLERKIRFEWLNLHGKHEVSAFQLLPLVESSEPPRMTGQRAFSFTKAIAQDKINAPHVSMLSTEVSRTTGAIKTRPLLHLRLKNVKFEPHNRERVHIRVLSCSGLDLKSVESRDFSINLARVLLSHLC